MTGAARARAVGLLLALGTVSAALGSPPTAAASVLGRGEIVLASDRGGEYGLYARSAPGVEPVVHRKLVAGGTQPAYSPDGLRIAYSTGGSDPHIVVMAADGTGRRAITPSGGAPETDPTWSPDGTRIAFTGVVGSGPKAHQEIFVVDASGGQATSITQHPADDHSPDWSPLGRIAFVSDRSPRHSIYTTDAEGGDVVSLGIDDGRWPAWSPDGRSLAYQGPPTAIHVRDASGATRVVSEGSMNGMPVWSPDGTTILYRRIHKESGTHLHRLYTVAAGGGSRPVLLSDGAGNDYMADWQPDQLSACSLLPVCP